MSKIKLIEQMQQTLTQLMQYEVQPLLSDIPYEYLLKETIARFPADPTSPQVLSNIYEFVCLASPHLKEQQVQQENIPPYVDIEWICSVLDISRSTFYESVNRILLFPVVKVGRRPYFLKSEVAALFERTKGMGPHILGKLASKARKNLID
ncbi:helix-turn-helix transcriptional regulator [Sphingobacterium sp. UDSM-2020]|uniref:helix-turn-helix transcriptional regulator n=1 Tax=Sphingobacterium sp. UDSM-2020 TaxID=2795738 RepID=UPI001938B7A8|nr:helix-turn-helix domain-containing protein [Sphingobacterium sp. UDSM-2020]QQD15434.1 helix-turn-helix domain-containing protein [Sphingobacterium sp. UDSM-2020]